MAKMTKTAGKGRVVTPATKGAKVTKSTTSKKAGVRTRPTPKRHADAVAQVRASAVKAGHKLPYANTALDSALAKADAMADSLTTEGCMQVQVQCPRVRQMPRLAVNGAPRLVPPR